MSKKDAHRIVLVDDHQVMREAFAQLLESEPDIAVCAQCHDAREAFGIIQKMKPGLAIIDITLDGPSGLELMKNVHIWDKDQRMLALSMHDEVIYAERALRAGAMGYVMKCEDADTVLKAVRMVLRGRVFLSERANQRVLTHMNAPTKAGFEALSDREIEVFTLTGQGCNTTQIARKLGLSPKTIETHRSRIKSKLNLKNGSELVHAAVSWMSESGQTP